MLVLSFQGCQIFSNRRWSDICLLNLRFWRMRCVRGMRYVRDMALDVMNCSWSHWKHLPTEFCFDNLEAVDEVPPAFFSELPLGSILLQIKFHFK